MNVTAVKQSATLFFFICFLFFLSSLQIVSVISLIALFVIWLFDGIKISIHRLRRDYVLLLFIFYYILHLISLLYSSNISYALFDLQVKLPFLLLPLILPAFIAGPKEKELMKYAFILGSLLISVFCLISSFGNYLETNTIEVLFYTKLSKFLHPTYFATYLNLAVLLTINILFAQPRQSAKMNWFLISSIFINSTAILLLSSRTSIVVFLLTSVAALFFFNRQKVIKLKDIKIMVGVGLALLLIFLFAINKYNRYSQIEEVISDEIKKVPVKENSFSVRLKVWESSLELIREHPLTGVGIGDIKDELKKMYEKNNFEYAVQNYMNPHNQYMHTAITTGLIGLFALLAMFFIPMAIALKHKDWLYFLFLIIIILNCLTESILERQAGILFFAFFNTLFYLQLKNRNVKIERI